MRVGEGRAGFSCVRRCAAQQARLHAHHTGLARDPKHEEEMVECRAGWPRGCDGGGRALRRGIPLAAARLQRCD